MAPMPNSRARREQVRARGKGERASQGLDRLLDAPGQESLAREHLRRKPPAA